ncbi:MAG: helicase-related protein [Roseiflexaceae bacterium]|nr:helicase-related protein [Roseiflexaceae bacterium]
MPTIFDNISQNLSDGLQRVLPGALRCSFCVGYLNLRGWNRLADWIDRLPGGAEDRACRLLVGMYRAPEDEMRALAALKRDQTLLDGPTLARLRRRITEGFRRQIEQGMPSNEAETALRRLAEHLRARRVFLKAFLRYPLHAKLYLVERQDSVTPLVGFVGSSNLTFAGLTSQGELNVDVVEQDAARKLLRWFDDRWNDPTSLDLSDALADLIESSWVRRDLVRPHLVYLKMAYHLCAEAREGERKFKLPQRFQGVLLDFQEAAVSLAAHYLSRRGGVLLGDVVGLGKTLMATAVARVFQEDAGFNTLVICPPKLAPMWERYLHEYEITGRVVSLGRVTQELPDAPRYRLVIIDESHNLRNREGRRYRAIREYVERNESRVLLLTATPYNKQFSDLSNQLRLFLDEDQDLRVRPERFFQAWAAAGRNDADFIAQFQTSPHSLRAFDQSPFPDDWRDLMRLFLVRRTRQFIIRHYARFDAERQRFYVTLGGQPAYFPLRQPRRAPFALHADDPGDQYARLFHDDVVQVIEHLALPRYGLAQYLAPRADRMANDDEKRILENLNRAGRRLIGFCRTNLFKRLESSGHSFLLSLRRHIVRNLVTLHALERNLPLPIGVQDAALLDTALDDSDEAIPPDDDGGNDNNAAMPEIVVEATPSALDAYRAQAARVYALYASQWRQRFDWLPAKFFRASLKDDLRADAEALLRILERAGSWNPDQDAKLAALVDLLTKRHPHEKALVFTQFADTAAYLEEHLKRRGVMACAAVTGATPDPVALARRFSPATNGGLRADETELRILIATDVLAEGQNLQDAHIVINYDLPWAIIRLIQRAGRVDRIGQRHDTILVYSFLPADGVERIIRLRQRLLHRLQQNQEVIGSDKSFFGEDAANALRDLYTEKSGVLDDDLADEDIDLASVALQVWNSASGDDQKAALALPPIVAASRALPDTAHPVEHPPGVIAYLKFPDGSDALVRVDRDGNLVSQSISAIFRAAACPPDTPPQPHAANHHDLVARCAELIAEDQTALGGQLGSLRSTRRKVWERLKRYRDQVQARRDLFADQTLHDLDSALDLIWRFPLKRAAQELIGRQLRLGVTDEALLEMVLRRAQDDALCEIRDDDDDDAVRADPQVICSLGLVRAGE